MDSASSNLHNNHQAYQCIQNDIILAWSERHVDAIAFFGLFDPCDKASVQVQWLETLPQPHDNICRFENLRHFVEERRFREIATEILRMKGPLNQKEPLKSSIRRLIDSS